MLAIPIGFARGSLFGHDTKRIKRPCRCVVHVLVAWLWEGFRRQGQQFLPEGIVPIQTTYSLHCSSFFWFNQIYNKDPIR